MTKLKREPIVLKHPQKNAVLDFPKLEITVDGETFDLSHFSSLENISEIVSVLKKYLKTQSKGKSVFRELRKLLEFFLENSGKIDEYTLIRYKVFLDACEEIVLTTKYQKFLRATGFVKLLISENVIEDFPIPLGFENVDAEPKETFCEIARTYIEDDNNFDNQDIQNIADHFDLDRLQAKTIIYDLGAIDLIHQKAVSDIKKWEEDWDKVEKIIKKLDDKDLDKLRCVTNFTKEFPLRERSLEEAFQILYSKFGNNIPAVKYWPKGMEEFFRFKKWKTSRVKGLLNGSSKDPDDLDILNKSLKKLSTELKKKLNEVEDYYIDSHDRDPRSIELALSILYANYGRILPESQKWPIGLGDYLKYRNWSSSRILSAFFPTPHTLTPFIVGLLSHVDIAPNVDSVAFYTYLSSFRPSNKEGKVNIFIDKKRSTPTNRDINSTDPMIALCMKHSERMSLVLKSIDLEETKKIILQKDIPLLLQHNNKSKRRGIHTLDPTTVVDIVKRFLVNLSENHPFILPLVQGKCTGQNFRPTIGLIKVLTGNSLASVQRLFNHKSSSTTQRYTDRLSTKGIMFSKSKKFQNFLVENSKKPEFYNSKELLSPTTDHAVDEWISCDAKRIWFKDNEVIAEWIAWERIISVSEDKLKFENPIRWENYWLPRLVKYQTLLGNVLASDKKNALIIAANIKLPPLS